jgi:serine/threonine-protein kinase RsbW
MSISRPFSTEPPPIELKLMSDPATLATARRRIERFAAECGFDDQAVGEIGLCVNEAMANVIRHAYAGRTDRPIAVSARYEARQIIVTIRDWGSGVDPSRLPERPYDPLEPGGIGMICLKRWMDEVRYQRQPDGGMLTTLIKRRV